MTLDKFDFSNIIESSNTKEYITMPDLMQMLFDHIIDHTHEIYCLQTKRAMYQSNRDILRRKLEAQLTKEQQELFEEYIESTAQVEIEDLYAMFLAAFDQSAALFRHHIS